MQSQKHTVFDNEVRPTAPRYSTVEYVQSLSIICKRLGFIIYKLYLNIILWTSWEEMLRLLD